MARTLLALLIAAALALGAVASVATAAGGAPRIVIPRGPAHLPPAAGDNSPATGRAAGEADNSLSTTLGGGTRRGEREEEGEDLLDRFPRDAEAGTPEIPETPQEGGGSGDPPLDGGSGPDGGTDPAASDDDAAEDGSGEPPWALVLVAAGAVAVAGGGAAAWRHRRR